MNSDTAIKQEHPKKTGQLRFRPLDYAVNHLNWLNSIVLQVRSLHERVASLFFEGKKPGSRQ